MMVDEIQQLWQLAAVHSEKFIENQWIFGLMVVFWEGQKMYNNAGDKV